MLLNRSDLVWRTIPGAGRQAQVVVVEFASVLSLRRMQAVQVQNKIVECILGWSKRGWVVIARRIMVAVSGIEPLTYGL